MGHQEFGWNFFEFCKNSGLSIEEERMTNIEKIKLRISNLKKSLD